MLHMWNQFKKVRGSSKKMQNKAPIGGARQGCRNTTSV